jgi:hypothetical protein
MVSGVYTFFAMIISNFEIKHVTFFAPAMQEGDISHVRYGDSFLPNRILSGSSQKLSLNTDYDYHNLVAAETRRSLDRLFAKFVDKYGEELLSAAIEFLMTEGTPSEATTLGARSEDGQIAVDEAVKPTDKPTVDEVKDG